MTSTTSQTEFRPALIVVDMQEDFCPPNGSLAVQAGRTIAPVINDLLSWPGFAVKIATQDFHPTGHISFASNHPAPSNKPFESFIDMHNPLPGRETESKPQRLWPNHCVQGTKGAEIIPEISIEKIDVFIHKGMDEKVEMYSAFDDAFGNGNCVAAGGVDVDLESTLKKLGITDVFSVGLAGDYCVLSTAIDAAKRGFRSYVVEQAVKCVDPGDGWRQAQADMATSGAQLVDVKATSALLLVKASLSIIQEEFDVQDPMNVQTQSDIPPTMIEKADPEPIPYWLVNVPPSQWPQECPDYLRNVPAKTIMILSTLDSEYIRQDWEQAKRIVSSNRIEQFQRLPSDLRKYLEYIARIKSTHGSVLNFVVKERLRWDDALIPKGTKHFEHPDDYKILYNDWPYGMEKGIIHLVVWTKFPFEDDPDADDLTPGSRAMIDTFVGRVFRARMPEEKVLWFRNWKSLKSIHTLEHFHVMLHQPDMEFIREITGGDIPLIDKVE
ncbi:hypothetical protein FQN57_004504 [Myotisia sp. PD_48]|nr:hypothetical protein FQN57_004504 [Myotisia sp. PD_48]